jgi:hypothetical protein
MTGNEQKGLADIVEALSEYTSRFRRQELQALEPISGLYALFPDVEMAPEVTWRWSESTPWPHGDRAGVYFVFGTGVRLLYIGKASMGAKIGNRLSHWFQYERPGRSCRVVHAGWREQPRFVAALPVSDDMTWEAPALEEFLIQRLSPPDNSNGCFR